MPNFKQNELSDRFCRTVKMAGEYRDGAGLVLRVDNRGNKKWMWRRVVDGKRSSVGVGSLAEVSLKEARAKRDVLNGQLAKGEVPTLKEVQQPPAAKGADTFEAFARALHTNIVDDFRNKKHGKQWLSTLERYVFPLFGHVDVADVDATMIEVALRPIWRTKSETARRVLQRIDRVLDAAIVKEKRTALNPCPAIPKLLGIKRPKPRHMPAIPASDLPGFYEQLCASSLMSHVLFRFQILTVKRPSECRLAKWEEFDLEKELWLIPAQRTKKEREHCEPLSAAAINVLEEARRLGDGGPLVFPTGSGKAFSDAVFSVVLKRHGQSATAHGMRSTFKDWAEENAVAGHKVIEAALSHVVRDQTEAAYLRTDFLEQRRPLMETWARIVTGGAND